MTNLFYTRAIALTIFAFFVGYFNLASNPSKAKLIDESNICIDQEAIVYLQKFQFKKAQEEILNVEDCSKSNPSKRSESNHQNAEDFDFHKHNLFLFKKEIATPLFKTDGQFYTHNYGGVEIIDSECYLNPFNKIISGYGSLCKKLAYYNIWKNGNEYIRSLLYRYSNLEKASSSSDVSTTKNQCKLGKFSLLI